MKCPECGAWNRASMPLCYKCGTSLTPNAAQQPSWREEPSWREKLQDDKPANQYYRMDDQGETDATPDARDELARDMAALKERKATGARRQRRLREESYERGSAPSSMPIHTTHATGGTIYDSPPVATGRRGGRTAIRYVGQTDLPPVESDPEPASYDPLYESQTDRWDRGQLPHRNTVPIQLPKRNRWVSRLLRAGTILLIVVLVALVGYFGWHYFQDQREDQLESQRATVVSSMLDGLAAHTIMIPGEDGQQIYIRELHTAYVVTEGFATITVQDHTWYDSKESLTEDQMSVTITPFLKTASGRQQQLEPVTFIVDIPISPITKITPETDRITVAASMYTMSFQVRPGSKVTVNGVDISDTVNAETGELSYNYTVQPIGDNLVSVTVRSQYCRENTINLVIYRAPQEIPLDMAADTFTSTSSKSMRMRMTTLPGATVDVTSPYTDLDITNLNTTGEFSFYAVFDHIGDNVIEVTASYPGKQPSTIQHTVYYVPSVDDYTRWAWPLAPSAEYNELVGNLTYRAEHSQVYVITGHLQYFISNKPQIAVFNTSEDDQSQPVVVQNYTRTSWEAGKYYRLYADVTGTYDSMPWLSVRFTYTY